MSSNVELTRNSWPFTTYLQVPPQITKKPNHKIKQAQHTYVHTHPHTHNTNPDTHTHIVNLMKELYIEYCSHDRFITYNTQIHIHIYIYIYIHIGTYTYTKQHVLYINFLLGTKYKSHKKHMKQNPTSILLIV